MSSGSARPAANYMSSSALAKRRVRSIDPDLAAVFGCAAYLGKPLDPTHNNGPGILRFPLHRTRKRPLSERNDSQELATRRLGSLAVCLSDMDHSIRPARVVGMYHSMAPSAKHRVDAEATAGRAVIEWRKATVATVFLVSNQ